MPFSAIYFVVSSSVILSFIFSWGVVDFHKWKFEQQEKKILALTDSYNNLKIQHQNSEKYWKGKVSACKKTQIK